MTNKRFNHTQAAYFEAIAKAIEEADISIMIDEINTKGETVIKEIPAAETVEFLNYKIEQINSKKTPSGKDKVNAEENIIILNHIKNYLAEHANEGFTCSQLVKIVPAELSTKEISLPRISAILNKAVKENNGIIRYEEKRTAYFKLAE